MTDYEDRVTRVIKEYIKPSGLHLMSVERIYENITDEDDVTFSKWSEVEEEFTDVEWDGEKYDKFVEQSKQIVETGETRISETFFDIVEPDEITLETVKSDLNDTPYQPEKSGEEKDGFEYEVTEKGSIEGHYIYTDVETNLSFTGKLQNTMSDGFIEFEIVPEKSLLILKSTRVTDVQKARKYFGRKTNMEIAASADYTTHRDGAVERINKFLDSFEEGRQPNGDEPGLLQVSQLRLYNPLSEQEDEDIENIEFEGSDIQDNDEVNSYLGDDDASWVIKRLKADVHYLDDLFTVTVGTTKTMSYGKVSGSSSYENSSKLSEEVREKFLEHLRIRD